MLCKEAQADTQSLTNIRTCHECGDIIPEDYHGNTKYCKRCAKDIETYKATLRKRKERRLRRLQGISVNPRAKGTMYYLNCKKDLSEEELKEKIRKEKKALGLIK